mgnify:FL=1
MKKLFKLIKHWNNYCIFIEQERVNSMVYCGKGWG